MTAPVVTVKTAPVVTVKDGRLRARAFIPESDFQKALHEAYLESASRVVVPGVAPGLATRAQIEAVYGAGALHDEALDIILPRLVKTIAAETGARILGRPELKEVKPSPTGGLEIVIETDTRPEVVLGRYKGLEVDLPRDDPGFADRALTLAAALMTAEPPKAMIDSKLDSLLAAETLAVQQDGTWRLLSDVTAVLAAAFREAGVTRAASLTRAEALDAMLETVADENFSKELLSDHLKKMVARYRDLPDDFDETLKRLFEERARKTAAMSSDSRAREALSARLGSMGLTESSWRERERERAAQDVRLDLLLEAVSASEGLNASDAEVATEIAAIASRHGLEALELMAAIDREAVRASLSRDKARRLIIDSATPADER